MRLRLGPPRRQGEHRLPLFLVQDGARGEPVEEGLQIGLSGLLQATLGVPNTAEMIAEADVICLVVDGSMGVTDDDEGPGCARPRATLSLRPTGKARRGSVR